MRSGGHGDLYVNYKKLVCIFVPERCFWRYDNSSFFSKIIKIIEFPRGKVRYRTAFMRNYYHTLFMLKRSRQRIILS